MPWIGAIGAAVASVFGASLAAGSLAAMVIGGIVVGAAVGAIYSAVTGGSILKGMLYGAIGGAVVGAGGYALGFGAAGGASGGTASLGAGESLTTVGGETFVKSSILGGGTAGGGGAGGAAGTLFTSEGMGAVGAVASMGSAFLQGGNQLDPDAQIAEREKDRQLQRELAQINASSSGSGAGLQYKAAMARIEADKEMHAKELAFNEEKFTKEFDESQWRYRDEKTEAETARQRFEQGIGEASNYVAGNMKSVTEVNQDRRTLPAPVWSELKYSTEAA